MDSVKYKFDSTRNCFRVSKVLPVGATFPFNFGFFPGTRGEDGDPLDILIMSDAALLPGTLAVVRILGNLHAQQTEKGAKIINDRYIGVLSDDVSYQQIRTVEDLSPDRLKEIEHFFCSYNEMRGREFIPLSLYSSRRAASQLKRAIVHHKTKDQAA